MSSKDFMFYLLTILSPLQLLSGVEVWRGAGGENLNKINNFKIIFLE